MARPPKSFPALFYRSPGGREPVRDWLRSLDREERRVIGEDLRVLELAWPVGMPMARSMGGGLYELRSHLPRRRTARVMFSVPGEHLLLLHAFLKKSRSTPLADLQLARQRLRAWRSQDA